MYVSPVENLRKFAEDERGIAGAIGIILLLAVAVGAYAHAVRTDIPVYGKEAERQWDESVSTSLRQFSRSISDGLQDGTPVTTMLPPPPTPRAIDVPLMGRTEPLRPSGIVSFTPQCASIGATHRLADGSTVTDLRGGSTGCLSFEATPTYSDNFGYTVEFGGILRTQGTRAVVVAGPPLKLDAASSSEYRIALGLPGLRGQAVSASNDASSVRVDLVPGPSSGELEHTPNAGRATWTFETRHPSAWKTWFENRFTQAGFVASRANPGPNESTADYSVACMPVDCSRGTSGKGIVTIVIEGPRTDSDDLKLSVTYGIFDVNIH